MEASVELEATVAENYFGRQYQFEILQLLRRLFKCENASDTHSINIDTFTQGHVLREFFTAEFVGALLHLLNDNLSRSGQPGTSASEFYTFLDVYMRCIVLRCSPTMLYQGQWPGCSPAVDADKMPRARFMALLRALDPAAPGACAVCASALGHS